jgi:hypothetical protein
VYCKRNERSVVQVDQGSSSERYHIDDILEATNLCRRKGTTVDEIIPLLDHKDPGIRYWAVVSHVHWVRIGTDIPELGLELP